MKLILLFIAGTSPLWGIFDVHTSWLRTSSASATGTPLGPEVISQVTTGNPATVYNESYYKEVGSDDSGVINLAVIDYDLNTNSSGQGVLNSYSFSSEAEVLSTIVDTNDNTRASTSFDFSSSIEITTNTSFQLEALLFNRSGLMNDLSLWLDDALLWSNSSGFEPTFWDGSSGFAQYGLGSSFEIAAISFGGESTEDGLTGLALEVAFKDSEPAHKFELRSNWEIDLERGTSAYLFIYDLELSAIPEVSQFWLPAAVCIFIFGTRRRYK